MGGGRGYSGGYSGGYRGGAGGYGYGGRGGWYGGGRGWYGGRGWWGGPGYGWGFGLGPGYWGFGSPYWYGGFPFWYATVPNGDYYNPYYASTADYGGYNYSQPIPQTQQQPSQNGGENPEDNQFFAQARSAFYSGNYQDALRNIEHAAIDMPGNQDVHQFHSLVLFALGDYQRAAAVAHSVLERGPGWNWSALQSFYPSADVYTQQLRGLEHTITDHDQAANRFLLGYEYLMLGHLKAAKRQFTRVVAMEPRDLLAKNILAGVDRAPGMEQQSPTSVTANQVPVNPVPNNAGNSPPSGQPQPPGGSGPAIIPQKSDTPPELPPAPPGPPTNAQPTNAQPAGPPSGPPASGGSIVGTWKSTPGPGVTIEATLQGDGHFNWKFTEGTQSQGFSGTYQYQGDNLVLTRQDGQKMDGVVTTHGNNGFRFRLKNTDPNDPGLEFTK